MKEHDATEIAFKNGYKKAVEDVFEDIEKCMEHDYISTIGVYKGSLELRIAELKKKYTEGKDDNKANTEI